MKTKAEGLGLAREQQARKRSASVVVSQLAFDALVGKDVQGDTTRRVESAIRVYLSDKDAGQAAWPYPRFLQDSETQEDVTLRLKLDPDLWLQFEAEAKRQGVSIQQLFEHAAFYFAAELDAGRITQRILNDLETTKPKADPS